jgi:hypothetical protein
LTATGTPSLGVALRPAGASLGLTGGTPSLGVALRPASASAGLSGGPGALVVGGLTLCPSTAALALSGAVPLMANAGPTPESRKIQVDAWWHAGDITEAERQYLIAEAASIAARQAC